MAYTQEQVDAMLKRIQDAAAKKGAVKEQPKKKSKYNNVETYYDGKKFDSKKECERYKELKQSNVEDLQCQVKYPITINGVKVCGYVADFVYKNHKGELVVEDVKSEHTRKLPVYRIKMKLMKAVYGIEIKEV